MPSEKQKHSSRVNGSYVYMFVHGPKIYAHSSNLMCGLESVQPVNITNRRLEEKVIFPVSALVTTSVSIIREYVENFRA